MNWSNRIGSVSCQTEFHPSCSPMSHRDADLQVERMLGQPREHDMLHVGTCIPRKRIDVLLHVFAGVKKDCPDARLIRVGGRLTPDQTALSKQLNVCDSIVTLPRLEWDVLAAVYRRASVVLLPSEREGFGLPVAEAMACSTPVVADDLKCAARSGGRGSRVSAPLVTFPPGLKPPSRAPAGARSATSRVGASS